MSALTLILKAAPRRDSLPYVGLRILVGVQNKSAVKVPVQALPETAPFRMSERDLAFIQTFRKKNSEEKEERRVYKGEVVKTLSVFLQERKRATYEEVDRTRQHLKAVLKSQI